MLGHWSIERVRALNLARFCPASLGKFVGSSDRVQPRRRPVAFKSGTHAKWRFSLSTARSAASIRPTNTRPRVEYITHREKKTKSDANKRITSRAFVYPRVSIYPPARPPAPFQIQIRAWARVFFFIFTLSTWLNWTDCSGAFERRVEPHRARSMRSFRRLSFGAPLRNAPRLVYFISFFVCLFASFFCIFVLRLFRRMIKCVVMSVGLRARAATLSISLSPRRRTAPSQCAYLMLDT